MTCDALLSALRAKAGADCDATARSEPWHSATLSGARHMLTLRFEGPDAPRAAERLLRNVDVHEFALPGVFVAGIDAGSILSEAGFVVVHLEVLILDAD